MKFSKTGCSALVAFISRPDVIEGFRSFLIEQIRETKTQLTKAQTWEETLRLQGKCEVLNQMLTLKEDVKSTLEGDRYANGS